MSDFSTTGCAQCRHYWLGGGGDVVERLGVSMQQQAKSVRCRRCGQLWENPNGNYPAGVSELPAELR